MINRQQFWVLELARIRADQLAMKAAQNKTMSDEKLLELVDVANVLYNLSNEVPLDSN
jgi:hypothetical protein